MIKIFIILGISLNLSSAFAQKKTIAVFSFSTDPIAHSSAYEILSPLGYNVTDFGRPINYQRKILSTQVNKDSCKVTCEYFFADTSCAFIFNGFGFETFVIPGDTLLINIGKYSIHVEKGGFPRPWFNEIQFGGRNKYIYCLFDSLANIAGAINIRTNTHIGDNESINTFLTKITDQYQARHIYLNVYCKKYGIPDAIKKLAQGEIYYSYIKNLQFPIFWDDKIEYPELYKHLLNNILLHDQELYFKTNQYSLAAYLNVINKCTPLKLSDDGYFVLYYNNMKNASDNRQINDHLTSQLLVNELSKDSLPKSFDSVYNNFKSVCINKNYLKFTDSLYELKKNHKPRIVSYSDALNNKITNLNGVTSTVNSLFKKKPLVLICWASWCVPCIKEIPFEKSLQKIYNDKIDFVYLSFDFSKTNWKNKSIALNIIKNSLLLNGGFHSDFSSFYKMNSIPQYFVYDKNEKLINIGNTRPSDGTAFKSIMDNLVSK